MKTNLKMLFSVIFVLAVSIIWAQKTVTGTVTDEDGLSVSDATVSNKTTGASTSTDFDGNYSIQANQGDVLEVETVSYALATQTVGTSNVVNFSVEASGTLDEVVVTSLGIERQKRALGYANVNIEGDELTRVNSANPFETLSGKVPGVDISAPTQPGASMRVINRGFSSVTNNQPLLIIDGTPTVNSTSSNTSISSSYDSGTSFNDIDPSIIESVNFLKGAAATALYGERGTNGVIIVTTKKGKKGIQLDYTSAVSFSEVSRTPHIQYEFGQGWDGKSYSNVSGEGSHAASNENGSWGARFDGAVRPWGRIVDGAQQIKPYNPLKGNTEDFYTTGVNYTNTIRVAGGGEHANASLNYSSLSDDGVNYTRNDKYVRNTFGFNGGLIYDRVRISLSANYVHKKQAAVPDGQGDDATFGPSLFQELLQMPNDISIIDMKNPNNLWNSPSNFFTPYAANPFTVLNNNIVNVRKDRLYGNVDFGYDLRKDLTFNYHLGMDVGTESVKRWGAIVNYTPGSAQASAGANPVVGAVREQTRTDKLYDTYASLNYDHEFSSDFKLNAFLGGGYQERSGTYLRSQVTNLDLPNFYELSNSAERPDVLQSNYLERYYYMYGQAELGFKNKYFLTLTGRNDWSSRLPTDNNSYFYPSVALSAVVLEGKNFLKLRGSWAQAGNSAPIYSVYSTASQAVNAGWFGQISFPFGGVNAFEIGSQLGNLNLKNELTSEFEIGMEGNFLNNRLNVDLSYYDRKTDDMIIPIPLPRSTGYSSIVGNFAKVKNSGWELMLDTYPVKGKNFQWNFTYTFAKNSGKVLEVANGTELVITSAYGVSYKFVEGDDIGTFYAVVPKMTADGQYIVNADTGYYETTAEEQKIGSSQRDFVMGFLNAFTYKSLTLNLGFDWKKGGQFYSYTKRLSHFVGNGRETIYNDRNPFIVPNSVNEIEDANGNITYVENTTPIGYEDVTGFYNIQSNPGNEYTHVISKTFFRLREASLTYVLPSHWYDSMGIKKMSFSVYGKNLFLSTPGDNPYTDPEATTYGNDIQSEFGEFAANPTQRYFGGIISLSF